MTDDKLDDSVLQALRQGLCGRRALPETLISKDSPLEETPLEDTQVMAMAAYLDGTMAQDAAEDFEAALLAEEERLELLLASRAALAVDAGLETPSEAALRRAQAIVAAPRREVTAGSSLAARLTGWFSTPWRPALGAAAFGLYALFCVQVFDWGVAGGEELAAVVVPELVVAEGGFGLSLDDIM